MANGIDSGGTIPPHLQLELSEQRKELQRLTNIVHGVRQEPDDEDVIDLREIWNLLLRRKGTIFAFMSAAIIAALLYSFLATPIYRSSLLLQIEREESKVVEYQGITPEERDSSKDFYQTQYELLQSRSLARRIIDQLGLETSRTFAPEESASFIHDALSGIKGLFSGSDATEEDRGPDLEAIFLENLSVEPIRNSRLVRISYESPAPEEAATIANAIATNFINTSLERRFDASSYAKTFLQEQIQQMRANLEDSERRLVTYARDREILNLDDRLSILLDKIKEMNSELIRAEAERIQAEADYQELLRSGAYVTGSVLNSPLIQTLKENKAQLESTYREQLELFKPGYPKMQQLQQQIDNINQEIATESSSIAGSVRSIFEAKLTKEAKLTQRINETKEEILNLQDRSTDYQTLKREVDTNRQLYDGLLQRMKEVGVVAGIGSNNIAVVDRAEVPRNKHKPSLKLNLAIALALGGFGGVLLAFLFEVLDDTLKTSEDVERRIGAPVLGVIPHVDKGSLGIDDEDIPLLAYIDPTSALSEAYRSLRTALVFSTSEGSPKVLHVTSASPGEGKTTTSTSLAIAFAQSGGKVLIIDADLRNPSLHRVFKLAETNSEGLTNYLAGSAEPSSIAKPSQVQNLFVITSGPLPPNPAELLSSPKMMDLIRTASEKFDTVIIDGPPIIGLADALVLAKLARATIFAVEAGETRIGAVEGSMKRLRDANVRILGAVLAKFGKAGSGYGYGYDYHYTYAYGGKPAELPRQPTT